MIMGVRICVELSEALESSFCTLTLCELRHAHSLWDKGTVPRFKSFYEKGIEDWNGLVSWTLTYET